MNIISDMGMPAAFIFFFVVVPGIALLAGLAAIIKRTRAEKEAFRTGIIYLKKLRILLMYIQQHRGLTNGFFHGNPSLAADIENLEQKISDAISDIQNTDKWIQQNGKWESLIDHWQRIKAYFKNANAEINLKQHNNLIANLLYLIDDLAYAHNLGKLGIVDDSDANWRKLLFIAEYVGQARALGMGVASKGLCGNVVRVQLNHLISKIKSNIDTKWPEETKNDFHYFLTVIQQHIFAEPPSINAEEYFIIATICIEHLLTEFDHQVDKIQFQSFS